MQEDDRELSRLTGKIPGNLNVSDFVNELVSASIVGRDKLFHQILCLK